MAKNRLLLSRIIVGLILAPALLMTQTNLAYAISDFYGENDIVFYNPSDNGDCGSETATTASSKPLSGQRLPKATTDYFTKNDLLGKVQNNINLYTAASAKTGVPWQAIAALHHRESGNAVGTSISNGCALARAGSVYSFKTKDGGKFDCSRNTAEREKRDAGEPWSDGVFDGVTVGFYYNVDSIRITADGLEDAAYAAGHLVSMAKWVYGHDPASTNMIKNGTVQDWGESFLAYNRGEIYKKAQGGEKSYSISPYVMNGFDDSHALFMNWPDVTYVYSSGKTFNEVNGVNYQAGALTVMVYLVNSADSNVGGTINLEENSNAKIDGSNVTIIGDSITVGSQEEIKALLPNAEINAKSGRQFSEGLDEMKNMNIRDILVFALGTNNAGLTTAQINSLVGLAGQDKSIIMVTNYGKADYTSNNNTINNAAATNKNISVVDWYSAVSDKSADYISADGVHPNQAGQELFAKLVYDGILAKGMDQNDLLNNCNDNDYSFVEVDGYVYPMAGATKKNTHISGLSQQPCTSPDSKNACHGGRNVWSLDLGVVQEPKQLEYCKSNGYGDSYCYATGGKVLALADGKFKTYKHDYIYSGVTYKDCASIQYQVIKDGKPVALYWLGHMKNDSSRAAGDTFKAGDVIGEVGTPYCTGNGSTAHLHIDQSDNSEYYTHDEGNPNQGFYHLINKLYEALPEE